MGKRGTTIALWIALAILSAHAKAAEPTQGGGAAQPAHAGEEEENADGKPVPAEETEEQAQAKFDQQVDEEISAFEKDPDAPPGALADLKEKIENDMAALKEKILNEDDPTKKSSLEKKLDKLAKAAEKIANVLTARSNANIDRIAANKGPAAAKPAATPPTASPAVTPPPVAALPNSTHQTTPPISSNGTTGGSRTVPSSNGGSTNRGYAYSERANPPSFLEPRTAAPSGKSSVPSRIPASTGPSTGSGGVSSGIPASPTEASASAPAPPAPNSSFASSPIVNVPSRTSAPSAAASSFFSTPSSGPLVSAPTTVDVPTVAVAPISRRQAEAAGVSVAPTPQARLAGSSVAAVENGAGDSSRGVTRKNEIGSTRNLYASLPASPPSADLPKGSSFVATDAYEKPTSYDSRPAPGSFYADKKTTARAQGQYIVLNSKPEEPEPAVSGAIPAVAETIPGPSLNLTGPAKLVRAAYKPVPTYNAPTVKDPIVEKNKAPAEALTAKKGDFKNFRENPFL